MDRPEPGRDIITGNVYDKYGSRNPIERRLVGDFMSTVGRMARSAGAANVLEVGCGEGVVSGMLSEIPGVASVTACDVSAEMLSVAAGRFPAVKFFCGSAYSLPFANASFDLVVACEVFEHLERPSDALAEMVRVSSGHLLASVPREPLWRFMNVMRGKYIGELGNTPGHVQHFSRRGFVNFLESGMEVTETASPIPWTVCLCRKRTTC